MHTHNQPTNTHAPLLPQPTLKAFQGAAPDFISMALESLEHTISEWKRLEATGLKLPERLRLPGES